MAILAARAGHRAYWSFNLYPEAGEGGGCFVPTLRARPSEGGGEVDGERSQVEAARRARAKLRRYCAANRLNRFATLTYAGDGCFDPKQLRVDVAEFFRGLRRELGGSPLPYAWASEWHPGGHGLHVHFAVGRYVSQRLIRDVWGRGITHIKLIGDLPVGSGALEEARRAAAYLAKYVSKNIGDERVPHLHRYEVAQGFQPEKLPLAGESEEVVIAQASERMGAAPVRFWRSVEQEGWRGPPGVLVCLGWMTTSAKPHTNGQPKAQPRRACPNESRTSTCCARWSSCWSFAQARQTALKREWSKRLRPRTAGLTTT